MNSQPTFRRARAHRSSRCLGLTFLFLTGFGWPALHAAEPAVRPVAWSPHGAHPGCRFNLGPTGAQAWLRGFQFEVMTVDAGSPADGILRPGDRILGVAGTMFSDATDTRMVLGNAIGAAEASDGALVLAIRRDGRDQRVTVRLPVLGAWAPTWPYGCAKSQRILAAAADYLLEAQLPNGEVVTDGGFGTYTAGLLWLATGDARYLDGARRAAYAVAATDLEKMDYNNWSLGYGGLLLAEYYLATGDTNVLDRLQRVADHLARGQMQCGSWGHSSPSAGYGALNQPGLVCAMTLALAQECGVNVDREALRRAMAFFSRHAELGAVPYGDHFPGTTLPDDNGKSSAAAVLCSLVPEYREAAAVFARSVALSYWLREEGHTGGHFSLTWGPLACALAGPKPFRTFMDYQTWYYNLSRTWRGAFVHLPYYEALTRFDDATYTGPGGEFTTGGMALVFALPQRKLRILGAPRSVFGANLTGPLLQARDAYQARRWDELAAARSKPLSPEETRWLAQLEAAAALVRSGTKRTAQEIENNLAEGDAYRAEQQFLALKKFLGESDQTIQTLEKRFADSTVQWYARSGRRYYEGWQNLRGVAVMSWVPYGAMAKAHVGDVPRLRPRLWETLAPTAAQDAWTTWQTDSPVARQRPVVLATTNYAALRLQLRSPRNSHTRIYLNGTLVAETTRGQRSGYAKIELDATALRLLRPGTNVLALASTSTGTGENALDLGLDAVPQDPPLPVTAGWTGPAASGPELPAAMAAAFDRARATYPTLPLNIQPDPAIPERLRVRDSQDRFKAALEAAVAALSVDDLQAALRSPVAYVRYLAGQSLARRGDAGRQAIIAGLPHADWRVRSACCDALAFGKTDVTPAVMAQLTKLLADEHPWVRCRAATALGAVGVPDAATATALVAATRDSDPWVRIAALGAVHRVATDPKVVLAAVTGALSVPNTSFAPVGRALKLIEKYGPNDPTVVPALIFVAEHPGEGMGAASLNEVLELLARLDPAGTRAVPVLARVAAGGYAYDRLAGNPRLRAIELLGAYGARAAAARSVLETILQGTADKEAPLRAAASESLKKIPEVPALQGR